MKLRYILTTIVISVVMMFAVIGCGGGGGDSSSGGDDSTSPNSASDTIPDLLDQQNSKVEAYFSKVEALLKSSSNIDEELSGVDPADTEIVDNILDNIEKNYLLSQDISKIGEEINEIEQRIQGNTLSMANPIKQKNYKRSSDIYSFDPFTIAAATYTVCMPFVTVYAATLALEHSAIQKQEDGNICREKYIALKRHVNEMEASEADKNATLSEGWNDFWDCRRRAGGAANERDLFTMFTASGSLLLSLPSAPVGAIAQTMSSASSFGDTATILEHGTVFTFGTRSDSDEKKNPKSFMSLSDSNGKLVVPEGDWNIAAFAPGYVRFGTRDGQSISVKEGETTIASIYTVPIGSVSSWDFEGCNDDSDSDVLVHRTDVRLNAVWAWSESGAIAAGGYDSAANGYKIYNYNGASWSESVVSIPDYGSIMDLWGTSENNIYAVTEGSVWNDGWGYYDGGKILHYNGTSWTVVSGDIFGDGQSYRSIWGTSSTNIYATGINGISDPIVYHFDGSGWSRQSEWGDLDFVGVNNSVIDIHGNAAGNTYLIGDNINSSYSSSIFKWSGSEWVDALNDDDFPLYNYHLNGVWVAPDNHVFLALDGWSDSPVVQYNPSDDSWNADINVSKITNIHNLESIWGNSSSDVYAVGTKYVNAEKNKVGGVMLHYNGTSWTEVALPEDVDIVALNGVSGVGKTFIVGMQYGSGGVILQK